MKYIYAQLIIILLMLMSGSTALFAQMDRPVGVRVHETLVQDDSVRLSMTFNFDKVLMNSTRKLVLTPVLRKGPKELALPSVILTGRRRMLDDRRAWNVNPQSRPHPFPHSIIEMPGKKKAWSGKKQYRVSVPYASWMRHAELLLEEREMNCCDDWLLAFNLLNDNLNLPDPCEDMTPLVAPDTVYIVNTQDDAVIPVEPEDVPLCVECTVIYVEFAQSKFDVRPDFSSNRTELAKVDSVLANLPKEKCVLHICGYASPEGILYDNEILARNRTESFAAYLKRNYKLPSHCVIETTSVGEDWDGLVKLLKQTGKPYAAPSLDIIETLGVFDGRERKLMELERGDPYRDMLETLFPYLRRIELRIRLEGDAEKEQY